MILLVNRPSIVAALTADHVATIASAWPKLHSGLRGMLRDMHHAGLHKALDGAERRRPR